MTQTAKAQEPSMEEILASIRRIIADDDGKTAEVTPAPAATTPAPPVPPRPAPVAAAPAATSVPPLSQKDIDAVLADIDATPSFAPPPAEEVLDLTEAMAAPSAPASPNFRTIDAQSDIVFSDRPAGKAEVRLVAEDSRKAVPAPAPAPLPVTDFSLMSSSTSAAVDTAFNSLASTILGQNARTLEDLVKEMLRPMLKSWLDDNLPNLVERIVRAEIERVSRGRM
jgi:cell pole-organizing protein PopZ